MFIRLMKQDLTNDVVRTLMSACEVNLVLSHKSCGKYNHQTLKPKMGGYLSSSATYEH